ncbi:MAG: hypothetical protein U1E15_14010 [Hyphomicrobiales bacterium]
MLRVPALILADGETLVDSTVIIDHLDEMAGPARALTTRHGPERRKAGYRHSRRHGGESGAGLFENEPRAGGPQRGGKSMASQIKCTAFRGWNMNAAQFSFNDAHMTQVT